MHALMLEDKSGQCIDAFSAFICAMHFPPCRFRVVVGRRTAIYYCCLL